MWGNRVPVAPKGANDSASTTAGGIGMRSVLDYIPERLSDASVLSTFAGAAAVYEDDSGTDSQRFVKLELEPTS